MTRDDLLTREEAEKYLHLPKDWLRRHTKDGPPYRKVGHPLYNAEDLDRWLESRPVRGVANDNEVTICDSSEGEKSGTSGSGSTGAGSQKQRMRSTEEELMRRVAASKQRSSRAHLKVVRSAG